MAGIQSCNRDSANPVKSCCCLQQIIMAIQPNPDNVPSMMQEDFGTKVLITNAAADKLLERASKHGTERYRVWCGGRNGFDDFAERLH